MTIEKMSKDLLLFAHNPATMQSIALNRLRQGGLELRDPTDPVVFLAEMATVTGHSIIEGMREILPEMFPSMAQRPEHLYRHISDRDLIDVFALPSVGELAFLIDVESLLQKAMPYGSARPVEFYHPKHPLKTDRASSCDGTSHTTRPHDSRRCS